MAGNGLNQAKKNRNDEFYTLYEEVEKEISRYVNYDNNIFKDKVILLPCDNPEWSNFVKYFFDNFNNFGLKKLIASSFNKEGQGDYFIFDKDNIDSIKWGDFKALKLKGDGDFASKEITSFRDEADFVFTNPPFSKIKDFFPWLKEKEGIKFSFIAPITCITYKDIFPDIKNRDCWFGEGEKKNSSMTFKIPDNDFNKQTGEMGGFYKLGIIVWLTNIEDGVLLKDLHLNTMAHNLKNNKKLAKKKYAYKKYFNYDAIEIPFLDAIPSDWDDLMGVPVTFLLKNNYRQFEIVDKAYGDVNFGYDENGKLIKPYNRLIIKRLK